MENTLTSANSLQEKTNRYVAYLFYTLLTVIFLLRTKLIGHGITYFADEARYFSSVEAVKEFAQGNFSRGITLLNSTQGRPGDAFVRLLPAIVQAGMYKVWGINTNTPDSLVVAVWMNWVVLILNTVLFYKIAVRLHGRNIAQVATVVYASLVNTNIYLRHILPYDIAVGIFLLALLLIVRAQATDAPIKKTLYFKAGALSGLCFAVYPGYFLAPLIVGVMAIGVPLKRWQGEFSQVIINGLLLVVGCVGVVLSFELIARGGSSSYLMSSRELSTTINQGDFSDGFSFAPEYLIIVERLMGWVLLGLLPVVGIVLMRGALLAVSKETTPHVQLEKLLILLIISWFCYASLAYFGHVFVFYGRTLHLFVPLLVLVCAYALSGVKHWDAKVYTAACCMLMLLCVASFLRFYTSYLPLGYEKDILFQQGIYYPFPANTWRYNTVCSVQDTHAAPFQSKYLNNKGSQVFQPSDTLVLINFGYIFPACDSGTSKMPSKQRLSLLVKAPVTTTYVPYQYEGWNAVERKILSNGKFDFAVYKLAPTKRF